MQIVKDTALTFLGIKIGPDAWQLRINKQEVATLKRAIAIREDARDRLREAMGWETFEDSDLYTLGIDDLVDTPIINFAFDYDEVGF